MTHLHFIQSYDLLLDMEDTKVCTKCNVEQPLSFFYKREKSFKSACKSCTSAYHKRTYLQYREECLAYNRKWANENRERKREFSNKWREENKEKCRFQTRKGQYRYKYGPEYGQALFELNEAVKQMKGK